MIDTRDLTWGDLVFAEETALTQFLLKFSS